MKQCRTCLEIKNEEEFYLRGGLRNGKPRNGRNKECIICHRQRTKRNSTVQSRRYNMVKFKHNLSKEQYDKLVVAFPVCGSCSRVFGVNEPAVDHCHITGKIRGLLCNNCNIGLGHYGDSIPRLLGGIAYLEKYSNGFNF